VLPLSTSQARVLDALMERVVAWATTTPELTRITKARVSDIEPGGAEEPGVALVYLEYGSMMAIATPYLSTYTPALNDVVAVARTGSQLLILGRIVGTPPE
jgi:hypothetical protein